ncbi:hypothetical protein LFREDSHE_33260 [Shewanella baltica]
MYVVHGSYFVDNFGDTLLVKLMCDRVAEIVGKENVYLATVGHQNEQLSIGYPVVSAELKGKVTHLIYAGGGYFGEPPSKGFSLFRWYVRNYFRHSHWLKEYENAKVAVFGVGFGPLKFLGLERFIIKPLKAAEMVLVRDKQSFDYLKKNRLLSEKKVDICVDYALSLDSIHAEKNSKIALHVPNLDVENIAKLIEGIMASEYTNNSIDFILDSSSDFSDERVRDIKTLISELGFAGSVEFVNYDNVSSLISRLSRYMFVITTKLHVGIVSTAIGTKVISVPGHPKTLRFYKQIELENFCIPKRELTALSITQLISKLDEFKPNKVVINKGVNKLNDYIEKFCKS